MTDTAGENLNFESAHTADEIKSYVLRTDSIALCCVADVHTIPQALKDIEAYWLGTVPCRTVRLVGILVSAVEYESRSIYSLDDGTGTINCIKKRPVRLETSELVEGSAHFQSRGYDIGDTVSVIGKIQDYKEQRQIFVSSIQRCLLPDAESRHILEVLGQHETRYSQPFTIPPLPIVATPQKHSRSESQSRYASSMASTPTTTGLSSPSRSPKKDPARLRHPSRLHSKDLNENVFRIYLSHILISTLSLPESSLDNSAPAPENDNSSTPRPSRVRTDATHRETTPKRPSRAQDDVFGSPTPKKPTAQYQLAPVPAEPTGPLFGVTLSYLRRVQVLADLARRVVDQAAHERDKVLRHTEKSERAKYEVSHPPTRKHKSHPKSGRPTDELRSSSGVTPSASKPTRSSYNNSSPRYTSTTQMHPSSSSSHISSSTVKSPSRAKVHRTEPLTPTEAARRAAYHAKQSKLHAEDAVKRPARMKRLFESALRTLVSEGGAVLHDGPKRHVPSSNKLSGKRALPALSGIWPDVTNTATAGSNRSLSVASSMLSGQTIPDLENTLEEDNEVVELSDPSDSEDAYLPVTPHTLRPVLLTALRQSLLRHRGGVDFASWMRTLRGDEQWARVPDLVLKEALEVLREEEWIDKVGGERWNFTRGSWARSLTLS
ncbi:hypothetical protein FS749_014434 [Ceratobasidium sp. UAMH 11750]|nr:hypothetical protein FS749_014434 [Ceratobasidium sp. UAMH 11750]